ncbi:NADH-quinone oxidoreductase subunit L [Metabacillus arenae]|uniref:NADH-quinone oxidoreductase subunit L n=1 Tax=Metabacillus arenae TaxID=2771434 RepID=A0A926NSP2_9BACI|nr:NADH-quinone oxidoreductase subunit L [Metabacillus arenae]MBD1383232.1 NADH-quinone oxidoreductase subunit L [Metabacillus arenae]
MMQYAWFIPIFPLLSFLIILIFGKRLRGGSTYIGSGLILASFLMAAGVLVDQIQKGTYMLEFSWLSIGSLEIQAGFEITSLNALMLLVVTLVSFLVHLYSRGYMQGDERIPVFYSYLGLFTFAMLGLVMTTNLLQLYIFWELVGVGSFLLIGFYFQKEEAKAAAKKAFIMTRIGDVGLFVGMLLLFWQVESFQYEEIFTSVEAGLISPEMITLISILIFIGAIGKSGQFPLHTWLPDAMEGPTPVSALIHAATMVAAGVYLVALMYPLFAASEMALMVVAVVGGFTAIFAASIGLVQTDIKRVLAYSTVSHLGYMMLALGSAGYVAGVFHLFTHAFFKALLFLAAGSVIHAVHNQNIKEMGGLWKKMRITGPLFLIGTLAISGFPFFSGFFSKEEILLSVWQSGNVGLFWLAVITSFLTAFYMFRLFFLVFGGKARGSLTDVKESGADMTIPMLVLAFLAIFAGYVNTPWFGTFMGDWLTAGNDLLGHGHKEGPLWIMLVATGISLAGMMLAYLIYSKKMIARDWAGDSFIHQILLNKYYVDEIYQNTVVLLTTTISVFCKYIDRFIVQAVAAGVASSVNSLGRLGSSLQSGQVQVYGATAFFGLVVLIVLFAVTGGYIR